MKRAKNDPFALRTWTQKNLRPEDYAFAVSSDPARKEWKCLATKWWNLKREKKSSKEGPGKDEEAQRVGEPRLAGRSLVRACLDWELRREFACCKLPPFLSVPRHQKRIKAVEDLSTWPQPAQWLALPELAPEEAARWIVRQHERQVVDGQHVHAFVIDHDEDTEVIDQRFRNWLTHPDKWKVRDKRGRWVERLRGLASKPGRKNFDALLRALAVRRLKEADFTRQQAADLLTRIAVPEGHKDTRISVLAWSRMPELARRTIEQWKSALACLKVTRREIRDWQQASAFMDKAERRCLSKLDIQKLKRRLKLPKRKRTLSRAEKRKTKKAERKTQKAILKAVAEVSQKMSREAFQRETGYTPEEMRAIWSE